MCELVLRAHQLSLAAHSLNARVADFTRSFEKATDSRVWRSSARNENPDVHDGRNYRSRLVLLGTAGGPVWWPGSDRQGISSVIVVGDAIYLVDCGEGWGRMFRNAKLGGPGDFGALVNLRAVFLTHLHSDHTVDYPNLLLHGLYNGIPQVKKRVQIFGPGRRGQLPPVFRQTGSPPPVMHPMNPTAGIVDMTTSLLQAYSADLNDRMRDNLLPDVRSLIDVTDIRLPHHLTKDPNSNPAPLMDPIEIFEDENVRVSCILVDHAPVFPAFAFRFDTTDGAVVFSGDTGMGGSTNIARLARSADYLVHEVIDRRWVESLFPEPHTAEQSSLIHHLLASHTEIGEVGKVAEAAGVRTLVLSHLVPGNNLEERWLAARKNFSGSLVVGRDLTSLGIGQPRA